MHSAEENIDQFFTETETSAFVKIQKIFLNLCYHARRHSWLRFLCLYPEVDKFRLLDQGKLKNNYKFLYVNWLCKLNRRSIDVTFPQGLLNELFRSKTIVYSNQLSLPKAIHSLEEKEKPDLTHWNVHKCPRSRMVIISQRSKKESASTAVEKWILLARTL